MVPTGPTEEHQSWFGVWSEHTTGMTIQLPREIWWKILLEMNELKLADWLEHISEAEWEMHGGGYPISAADMTEDDFEKFFLGSVENAHQNCNRNNMRQVYKHTHICRALK